MSHGDADAGQLTPRSTFYDEGRFGRLFPTLPPFAADTRLVRDALAEIGARHGPMDADDDLTDPGGLITEPALSLHNPNNPTMTAGFTFFGQFVDHDMTFDPTSSLARRQDPESIRNFRIPALDLDSVYGGGPGVSPHLYDRDVDGGRTTLLTEPISGSAAVSIDGSERFDLPRNAQLTALVGDPRNDENLVVSQLHLAVLRFHNTVVADVRDELGPLATRSTSCSPKPIASSAGTTSGSCCTSSSTPTVGVDVADVGPQRRADALPLAQSPVHPGGVLRRRLPLRALAGAAELSRQLRLRLGTRAQFIALVFDPAAADPNDPADLRGGRRAPRRFIDWQTFFETGDGRVQAEQEDRHHAVDRSSSTSWASPRARPPPWRRATCCAP